jgi:inhibitor of cysteine peptidase
MVSQPADNITKEPILSVTAEGKVSPAPGEVIKVTIDGNPTTGYEWDLAEGTELTILNQTYIPDDAPGMTGAGGRYEWLLTADSPGLYAVGGEYKRSWEEDPESMFWFNVVYI